MDKILGDEEKQSKRLVREKKTGRQIEIEKHTERERLQQNDQTKLTTKPLKRLMGFVECSSLIVCFFALLFLKSNSRN